MPKNNSSSLIAKIKRCIIIKYILFYTLSIVFLFFFWYSLSSFGAVFQNTQKFLIMNAMISFCFSLIYPFIINLIPALLRLYSLKNSKRECIYKINRFIQFIWNNSNVYTKYSYYGLYFMNNYLGKLKIELFIKIYNFRK